MCTLKSVIFLINAGCWSKFMQPKSDICPWCRPDTPTFSQPGLMSIPFRFKAGGSGKPVMTPINSQVHHHRSTTKADHKPFKSRYATKSALKDLAKGQ
jgi:hypothetical protein